MSGRNEELKGRREVARFLTQELMEALWAYQHGEMTGPELLAVWRREAGKDARADGRAGGRRPIAARPG